MVRRNDDLHVRPGHIRDSSKAARKSKSYVAQVMRATRKALASEVVLVQGWEGAHTLREFYATLLGNGTKFQTHPADKQTIFALIATGAGVTLATEGQAEVSFPGIVFRPIDEDNAWLNFGLIWLAETEDPVIGRFVAFMRDQARSVSTPPTR